MANACKCVSAECMSPVLDILINALKYDDAKYEWGPEGSTGRDDKYGPARPPLPERVPKDYEGRGCLFSWGKMEISCWNLVRNAMALLGLKVPSPRVWGLQEDLDAEYKKLGFCKVKYGNMGPGDIFDIPGHIGIVAGKITRDPKREGWWRILVFESAGAEADITYTHYSIDPRTGRGVAEYNIGGQVKYSSFDWISFHRPCSCDGRKPKPNGPRESRQDDPLVVNLDGKGIRTVGLDAQMHFDHDGNGFREATGWIASGNGFLVLDRDCDGAPDNGNDLFGDFTLLPNGMRAANGFQALAQFDSNYDGKIDAQDPIWKQLRIWEYSPSDALDFEDPDIAQNIERIRTLDELGLAAIYVDSVETNITDSSGNTELRSGHFAWADGTFGMIAEYRLQRDMSDTIAADYIEVPQHIDALPNLKGYGNVYTLQQAMVRDSSGHLQELVGAFASEDSPTGRTTILEKIIYRWTGADSVAPDARGPFMDGRKAVVLEKFYADPPVSPDAGLAIQWNHTYHQLFEMFYSDLMLQTHLKDLYDQLTYTWNDEKQEYEWDMSNMIAQVQSRLADNTESGQQLLGELARSLRGSGPFRESEYLYFREAFIQLDPGLGWVIDTGGLPVYNRLGQSPDGWYYPHMFGTWGSDAVQGSATLGDGWINSLSGNDVLYGTERNERLLNQDGDSIIVAGGGDDIVWAGAGADILDPGPGTDVLYGDFGNDTYVLRIGSQRNTIIDADPSEGNQDTIFIGSSLTPDDIELKRVGNGLVVQIIGTNDSMTVQDFFTRPQNRIELIQFMDGTVWTESDMIAWTYTPTDHDDLIYGGPGEDELRGMGGNDKIFGLASNDILRGNEDNDQLFGGLGSDTLEGGSGADRLFGEEDADVLVGGRDDDYLNGGSANDRYLFARGDGSDTIDDTDTSPGNVDTLELGADILPTDVELLRVGNDLKLTILDTGDSVTVKDWLVNGTPTHGIELITFADGTTWDTNTIQDILVTGTEGADEITGFSRADFIQGFGSDDTIYGRGGDDTIVAGSGSDKLFGQDGNDTLVAGDHDDTLVGGSGSDYLDPGTGNDLLFGGDTARWSGSLESNGSDTYFFANGYGHDTVLDHDRSTGNTDTILLGDGITPDDVSLNRDGEDLVLSLNSGADTLTVQQWFWNDSPEYRVELIKFADGTTWDVDTVKEMVITPTEGDDVLIGTAVSDTLYAYGGNDRVYGRGSDDVIDAGTGDDIVAGEAGNDTLICGDGADIASGGTGDDVIDPGSGRDIMFGGTDHDQYGYTGSNGNDVFRFGRGYEQDTVTDYDATSGNTDTILLNDDVLPADVIIRRVDDNLVLSINGTDDTLTVNNWFADESGTWQVEQIQFADGTLWSASDIKQMVLQGTPGDDLLIGYSTDDTITGLEGRDTIFGNAGNDTIDPGPGDDYIEGGIGNDRYLFGRGYGQDTVVDYDNNLGNIDTISLTADVLPSDVSLEIDGTNLRVVINDTNDSVLVTNWFADDASKVERIEFADGTVWDTQYIQDNARSENVILGTPADDNLVGTDREDTLIGLQGNDTLAGGLGSDTYVLTKGSGMDRIVENDSSTGNLDVVQFLDITSTELDSMERWGNDLVLFYGDNDRLTVADYFSSEAARIEAIQFSDGIVLDEAALKRAHTVTVKTGSPNGEPIYGNSGTENRVYGLGGSDGLVGGPYADYLDGGPGNDGINGKQRIDSLIGGRLADLLDGGYCNDALIAGNAAGTLSVPTTTFGSCSHAITIM